ncbi:hypothetical protein BD780_001107 [Clostridium tetanomorphum]|uniref:Uncharacterized protein n=1 Tax=Clostridium tetanomorphum TaxID=1553 RepID=A0A923EF20_CLOTT|nr:hypothetical protein [Clostridium tetanomorphum]KAJ49614.1 hypothetical protein CTM_22003 [Clostridium tetanomorphum DSM 665]KAJ52453.1 hypothetical protein CTM_08151 [Clostridium tetanomorphum DSM 665]MBC2400068.1 hypothetical protein [Clostridium tetanomorphum]MBP1864704.1 hypothetical protein [Clostridium tetanomorphum]NRS83882.1 hypothetical protein [Clostridium tetanomorphum]
MNNKKFISNWKKYRRKGKKRYILENSIFIAIGMSIIPTIVTLVRGNEYYIDSHLSLSFGGLVGGLIAGLINWPRNERKYNELMNNNLDK